MKIQITHLHDHKNPETIDGELDVVYDKLAEKFPLVKRYQKNELDLIIKRLNKSQTIHIEVL